MKQFIILIFLLTLISSNYAIEIIANKNNDLNMVDGVEAELICEVEDMRDPLEECYWYSPNGTRHDPEEEEYNGISVKIDSRRDKCILRIKSLRLEHSGPWECEAFDGRDKATKYFVINVTKKTEPLQLLLQPDETELEVQRGDDVQIICPSNHHSNSASERSLCSFISPVGKKYQIVGKFGTENDFPEDGISHTGDSDKGQCGIIIKDIDYRQSGTWTCEVLRKQRPGSSKLGSEATSAKFHIDVYRRKGQSQNLARLQGYEEDDKNVEIIMEVEIDKRKEEFTDFYWIVRRNLRIFEGERECIRTSGSSRRDENCYESLRRTKIRNKDSDDNTRTKFFLGLPSRNNAKHIVKYELILLIDRLELEDMENRIFLVKDYREFNSKKDKYEVKVVSNKVQSESSSEETSGEEIFQDDVDFKTTGDILRGRTFSEKNNGNGCMISGEFVEKGDTYDHPEFCITLICNQDGNVDVRSLEESKCRRRRFTRDSIRKRFFLGMPSHG